MNFYRITLTLFLLLFFFSCSLGQENKYVRITEAGKGKVDTRVDNMGYWKKMIKLGYVEPDPVVPIPEAVYTGTDVQLDGMTFINSPDVPVASTSSTQSENSIFVDPADSQSIMNSNNSTTNPATGLYGADYLLSEDGGQSWGGSIQGAGGSNQGDPVSLIGLNGHRFIGFIFNSGQGIARSTDGGSTWTQVQVAPSVGGSFLDKNHLWIDNSPSSPYEGNLYCAWTNFYGTNDGNIELSRSTDDGLTWSTPINISSALGSGSFNQGVNIHTGPDGDVYAAWAVYDNGANDESSIGFAKSSNGGTNFGAAYRIISNIRGIRTTTVYKNHRVNSFPSMAVDISGGPYDGNIYVVWANVGVPGVNTGADVDVYMIRSTDNGTTWGSPVRVNQDPSGLGKKHYFSWITCDPVTGELSVIFYDDRNVSSSQCEVYVATSSDGGSTWEDFKVSDVAFTPSPIPELASGYFGDYLGISARDGFVYPVWTDNRNGSAQTWVSPFELSDIPYPAFTASNTLPCLNDTVLFSDQSLRGPTSWNWSITPASGYSFVNGTNAASQNPQVKFTGYGDYTVSLIVANSNGSDTLTRSDYISVNEVNPDFYATPTKIVINNSTIFYDNSSCNISSYLWNFGDGASPATATTPGPHTVTYSTLGFKTITLTLNGIATETKTDYIEVGPEVFNMSSTTITTCSGIFYDSQGPSGNYLDNESFTMTFYPADTSKLLQFVFTSFSLESHASCGYDGLRIYDGTSTNSTLLGTWCGTNSPGTVLATNSDGALTFDFYSDVSVTSTGWSAEISCAAAPPPSYCTAGASACDEYIASMSFNEINNASGCTNRYEDYTSLTAVLSPDSSYQITIVNGNLGYSDDQCGIWIDWNKDYDFLDANETIAVTGTPGVGPYTAAVAVPADAVHGATRLRARIMWTGTLSSCGTTNYGEVEDYTVYIGTPGLWKGGASGFPTDWNTATNWDDHKVPSPTRDILIPEGLSFYPVLSGTRQCDDILIEDNGDLNIDAGSTLNVSGNLIVGQGTGGSLIVNGGTCNVTGTITVTPASTVTILNGGLLIEN